MKRTAYIFTMLIALTACQEELIQDISSDGFVGTIEDFADQTRTSLAEGNYIAWSEGDLIAVFQGVADPDCFEVSDASAGKTRASFEAVSTSGSDGQNQKYSENIAIYPYSTSLSCLTNKVSGGTVLSYTVKPVNYPSVQSYKEDSFPADALVMAAVTESLSDRDLKFKAASAVLRFKVKGNTSLQSIKVIGNSDEPLSGNAAVGVNTDGSSPIVSMTNSPSSVTLDCGKGVALDESEATVFMLCIPPTDFDEGFTVTFTDTDGVEDVRTVSKSLSVQQGHIFGMSEITFGQQPGSSGEYDYIDEYGINHGPGVEIDGVVWAPVNCGYHETDFKYGKLYQWGRKYGQGYEGAYYSYAGANLGTISDSSVPSVVDAVVSLAEAQSQDNEGIFYKAATSLSDVIYPSGISLWNIGNETSPVKTEYDPCPEGWRVPTLAELTNLKAHKSSWTDSQGFNGLWFSGKTSYSSTAPRVFLCAAGFHEYRRQEAESRGLDGRYWSSKSSSSYAYRLNFDHNGNNVLTTSNSRVNGYSVRCVKDDGALVPVTSVTLNESSLAIDEGDTYTLSASISPSDANHQSAYWWSDDESVATVDQSGVVTAVSVGTATITAMAGMKSATCTVTVKGQSVAQEGDYIDEYGINHGQGVEIDGVVWAPVNCGYHETDYEYGKLYQWGRKYGQGYEGSLYDVSGNYVGTYYDATVPTVESGPVSLSTGQSESNEDYFYKNTSYPYDWLSSPDDYLWNSGTESYPVKTEYDPCPEGWRVPTYEELDELNDNRSSWTTDENGQIGYWFSGSKSYSSSGPRVFFPAAGYRIYGGNAYYRGSYVIYWSSRPYGDGGADDLYFDGSNTDMYRDRRAIGGSVRCVKDDGALVPVTSVSLNKSSVTMDEGDTYTLSVTISPSDANHKSAHWWSDDESIATVDQTGKITAVSAGTATITAMAGMKSATCEVTVKNQVPSEPQEGDYVDEYGINHGQGVEIDGVVWAPVNCGYHEIDFKYGKLYQWGRKYGQGYDGYDSATTNLLTGPVSLASGQSEVNTWNFYLSTESINDWLYPQNNSLWNNGTEDNPIKTEYDPCPAGWRVPTDAELRNLIRNGSSMTSSGGKSGYWFTGSNPNFNDNPKIFLTMSGGRNYDKGNVYGRGNQYGLYWSSDIEGDKALRLCLADDYVVVGATLRSLGITVRCVQDDGELVPVTSVSLDKSSVTMDEGDTYTLSASISPSDANHQSAHWWSDDESVVTVDQTGVVTAVSAGTATITAMAGMQTTTCTVTVKGQTVAQEGDYIDEYGINHGQGVEIDGVVWAPVNCGYHETDFKYGKLYQWGRKYGQGYDGSLYDINGNKTGTYTDAAVPTVQSGPVSLSESQSEGNKNKFYYNSNYPYDWLNNPDDYLWNSGTESDPVKTEYDPCPEGWRVPTYAELDELNDNRSSWTTNENGQIGYWFSGSKSYSSSVPRVFFPAAGYRYSDDGFAGNRGNNGSYWSSRPYNYYAYYFYFYSSTNYMSNRYRACGCSVRCVQIID